jgi:hypothetical protein
MSTQILSIVPTSATFIPHGTAQAKAIHFLRSIISDAREIKAWESNTTQFIHPVEYFKQVNCPSCHTEITDWWVDAVDNAYESNFENLAIATPCCHTLTTLNDLEYISEAAFARFALKIYDAAVSYNGISPTEVAELESILDCPIKQVITRL